MINNFAGHNHENDDDTDCFIRDFNVMTNDNPDYAITITVMMMMNMMMVSSLSPTVLLAEQEYNPESSLFTPCQKQ